MSEEQKFPSYRYGPDGASKVVRSEAETPEGWADHPSKVGTVVPKEPKELKEPKEPAVDIDPAILALTRPELIAELTARGVEFHKSTPTAALQKKLAEAAAVEG